MCGGCAHDGGSGVRGYSAQSAQRACAEGGSGSAFQRSGEKFDAESHDHTESSGYNQSHRDHDPHRHDHARRGHDHAHRNDDPHGNDDASNWRDYKSYRNDDPHGHNHARRWNDDPHRDDDAYRYDDPCSDGQPCSSGTHGFYERWRVGECSAQRAGPIGQSERDAGE